MTAQINTVFDPPLLADAPETFDTKAQDMGTKLNPWAGEANTLAAEVNSNALAAAQAKTDAQTAANTATIQAGLAASAVAAAATTWVSGDSYTVNELVWLSGTSGALYRCIQTHSGRSTTPDLDTAYWIGATAPLGANLEDLANYGAGPGPNQYVKRNASGVIPDCDALLDVPTSTTTSAAYTLQLTDRGKCVDVGHAITVPKLATVAFPKGSVINLQNNSGTSRTITAESGATVYLAGDSTKTGPFTLKGYGWVVLRKIDTASTWVISGAGI